MPNHDYNNIGFKNKDIDKMMSDFYKDIETKKRMDKMHKDIQKKDNDSLPKPTYERFNIPLITGPNPGTSQDSISYREGFYQGIKNYQEGYPKDPIGILDANRFSRAGKKDGFDAAKKKKLKIKKKKD